MGRALLHADDYRPRVVGVTLVKSETYEEVLNLADGMIVDMESLGGFSKLSLRAKSMDESSSEVEFIVFGVNDKLELNSPESVLGQYFPLYLLGNDTIQLNINVRLYPNDFVGVTMEIGIKR